MKNINNDIEYFGRFRSERTKHRIVIESRDKYLLSLNKREDEIWDIIRKQPLVPLEKPYQKGFVRNFVLREDVALRHDSEMMQQILDCINTNQYSYNKKFRHKVKVKGKRKKVLEVKRQYLKYVSFYDWTHKKPFIDFTAKQKRYFDLTEVRDWDGKLQQVYRFNEPSLFILKVYPYYITHCKPLDLELERERKLISNYIEHNGLKGRLYKLLQGGTCNTLHSEYRDMYYFKNWNNINYTDEHIIETI